MTTTYRQATSDMFGQVLSNLPAVAAILGYTPEVRWHDVPGSKQPDGSKLWMRVSRQTISSRQATLSTCVGAPGKVRYEEFGIVFVQLFAPAGLADSPDKMAKVAEVLRNVFRRKNTNSGVWFRNASIDELAPEVKFLRTNVSATFEYDEIY